MLSLLYPPPIALYYYRGEPGIAEKNYEKAAEYFSKGAAAGRPAAQHSLGCMYEKGLIDGVVDLRKAAELKHAAAMAGHQGALRWLVNQYRSKKGILPCDIAKAAQLMHMAV